MRRWQERTLKKFRDLSICCLEEKPLSLMSLASFSLSLAACSGEELQCLLLHRPEHTVWYCTLGCATQLILG